MEHYKERAKALLGERVLAPWWAFRKWCERRVRDVRRLGLRTRDFTVLSNNCFGGFVYQRYGLPYRTPTAGLFFMPADYLRLLSDPRRYFSAPLSGGVSRPSKKLWTQVLTLCFSHRSSRGSRMELAKRS